MDTGWLRVFQEVAASGSFTAAAERLGFTQSAISRQISALEQEVGAVLFDRLPRGVRPTAQGRSLLVHADALLARLDLARRDLQALVEVATGRLAVGAFASAEASLVPRALAIFNAAHPGVVIEFAEGLSPQLLDLARSGQIDVAVVSSTAGPALEAGHVELHHLLDEAMLVALPVDHQLADRDTLTFADLADDDWIAASSSPGETLLGPGPAQQVRWVVGEWTGKLGMVAAGFGVTLVPALFASGVRSDVRLVPLAEGEMPRRAVYAATAEGITPSPACAAFLEILRQTASAHV